MITTLKWYQVLFMVLGVYLAAVLVSKAIQNARELNALKLGMNENLCLLIKQLKKYDKEIAELQAQTSSDALIANPVDPVILPVDNSVKISELQTKRTSILSMISKITTENPYTVYCKPCDCEKHGDVPPNGILPPPPPPPDTTQVIRNGYRGTNGIVY